jgi:FkbM family methyltransferase
LLPPLSRAARRFIPNVILRIPHVEPTAHLSVRLRHHLGLIARGAKAYEPRYVEILRLCVEAGDCVFDVGANIGFYSVLFSRWVGSAGRVFAYEPDPANVRLLKKNVAENGCAGTVVRPVALGRECGSCAFSRDVVTGLTGHVGAGSTYGEVRFRTGKEISIEVPLRTLDAEIEMACAVPGVLKLDTEGGEYEVLCGGARALREFRPLIVAETSNWGYGTYRGVTRSQASIELLRELDYVVFDLDLGHRVSPGHQPWMVLAVPAKRFGEDRVRRVLARVTGSR